MRRNAVSKSPSFPTIITFEHAWLTTLWVHTGALQCNITPCIVHCGLSPFWDTAAKWLIDSSLQKTEIKKVNFSRRKKKTCVTPVVSTVLEEIAFLSQGVSSSNFFRSCPWSQCTIYIYIYYDFIFLPVHTWPSYYFVLIMQRWQQNALLIQHFHWLCWNTAKLFQDNKFTTILLTFLCLICSIFCCYLFSGWLTLEGQTLSP